MTADGYLDRVKAALTFLGCITAYHDDRNADCPPDQFFYGLSVIFGYLEMEVTEAYNEITKKDKEIQK